MKEYLSTKEACELLNISKSQLYKLTSSKEIPYYKPTGKLLYFKYEELMTWISKSRICSVSEVSEILFKNFTRK